MESSRFSEELRYEDEEVLKRFKDLCLTNGNFSFHDFWVTHSGRAPARQLAGTGGEVRYPAGSCRSSSTIRLRSGWNMLLASKLVDPKNNHWHVTLVVFSPGKRGRCPAKRKMYWFEPAASACSPSSIGRLPSHVRGLYFGQKNHPRVFFKKGDQQDETNCCVAQCYHEAMKLVASQEPVGYREIPLIR